MDGGALSYAAEKLESARIVLPRRIGSALNELRNESGQALIEFALVLLPLALLVMGIIDFGWIFKNYIGVRQGVRDAARQVSVGNFGTDSSCTLNGSFTDPTGNIHKILCLVHDNDDLNNDAITRVALVVGCDPAAPNNACNPPTYAAGEPITICEEYQVQSLTGAFGYISRQVHGVVTKTTMIVENAPTGALSPGRYVENSIFGSWSSQCPYPAPVTPTS